MSGKQTFLLSAVLSLIFTVFIFIFRLGFFSGDSIVPAKPDISRELIYTGRDDPERLAAELLPGELLDINTASKEQLMLLPGIGDVLSDEIIKYRQTSGGFVCIEDIMKINGIGEGKFSEIAEHITVNGGNDENTCS